MEIIRVKEHGKDLYILNDSITVPKEDGNVKYEAIKQWIANGNIPEIEFTDKELEEKELQSQKEKRELLLNSIIVEISTGKKFDGREKDRNNMLSAIQSAQFLNENQTIWKLADNTKQTITLDELKEALSLSIKRAGEIILGASI